MADEYLEKLETKYESLEVYSDIREKMVGIGYRNRFGHISHLSLTPDEARTLASMLPQAADVADGLPARPDSISDVPLSYVKRADSSE